MIACNNPFMTNPKSYDLDHLHLDQEISRLRTQSLLAWQQELRMLMRFGLQDGMTVLDLGSGPGFIIEQLLTILPKSQFIALDNEPAMLERARRLLQEAHPDRLRFVEASVMETGLSENSIDFAIARFLFQHLPDPVGAAREAQRILKPGGRLVLVDIDEGGFPILFDPPLPPTLEVMRSLSAQAQAARGGNRNIGRHFWRILRAAGFQPLDFEAIVAHSDMLGIEGFLQTMELYPESRGTAIAAFESAAEPLIMAVGFAACGQKIP